MQEQTFYDNGPTHVFLCAPTRSGKGVFHIQPTLRTWRHSALILDPKRGENYGATQAWRAHYGRVEAFAPYRLPLARINVLDTIRLKTLNEHGDALCIAQSLVAPHKMVSETGSTLHFRELAAMLLTAAILHVCYTLRQHSLAAIWHFLTQQHRTLAACLRTMRGTRHTPFGVHPAIAQLTSAIQNIQGDRELSSVWSTMVRPLSLYTYCLPRFCPLLHDVTCCEYNRFPTYPPLWQDKSRRRKDGTDVDTTARGVVERLSRLPRRLP
jgi:type IV secretion system protein VirD4